MKVREIIEYQIRDLGMGGVEPAFILMTPRAFDILIQEVNAELHTHKVDLEDLGKGAEFMGLKVILDPERSRLVPISVVGSTRAELDVYHLKIANPKKKE